MGWWHHHRDRSASAPPPARADSVTYAQVATLLTDPQRFAAHPRFVVHGTLRLEGQTVDDRKRPIGGVTVTLNTKQTTISEQDGSFAFTDLAAGDYELVAEKGTLFGAASPTLAADSEPVEIELAPCATAHIRVIDEARRPVVNARVEIHHDESFTDDHGETTRKGVRLGAVHLEVSADGYGPQRLFLDVGDDPHRVIEKTVVLVPGAPIAGTVVDQDGHAVPKASVSIEQGKWHASVDADASGRWTIPFVAAGHVSLTASADGFLAQPALVVTQAPSGTRDVVVPVASGASARGIVIDDHGAPVERATVSIGDVTDWTDEHGRFTLVGITPGKVEITATSDKGAAVVQQRVVVVGRPLDLQIQLVAGTIAGRVRDHHGDPVPDVMVWAKRIGSDDAITAHTEDDGTFDFGGVVPGDYELVAQHRADRTSVPDHGGVVVKSGKRDVQLVVAGLGSISGRVVDHGVAITYFGVGYSQDSTEPVRDDTGAFTIHDLPPGRYTVVLVGTSFARTTLRDITVLDDQDTDVGAIQVERGRVVRGSVRDPEGRPVAGAVVMATSRLDTADAIADVGHGSHSATTDASGAYEIAGVDEALIIHATLGDARSPDQELGTATVVDLVLAPTGAISGHVINMRGTEAEMQARGELGSFSAEVDATGAFSFDHLPAGDYDVSIATYDTIVREHHVHVEPGATAAVEFALPARPISVTVTSPGCKDIWTRTEAHSLITRADCTNGVAVFPDVTAGDYFACDDFGGDGEELCTPFTVDDQPIQIRIRIPDPVEDEPEAPSDP